MKTTSLRARALACALLAGSAYCGLAAAPAAAQTPREHRALDSNGVDLTHGDFVMAFAEGSIGSGDGELALVRFRVGSGHSGWFVSSGGHQWDGIFLTRTVGSGGTHVSVGKDDRYEKFSALGTLPTGSSLALAGNDYQYRAADGTLIQFGDPIGGLSTTSTFCNGSSGQGSCNQVPISIGSPDGKSVSLAWEVWESCLEEIAQEGVPPNCLYWARLASVSNSFGYRIAFTYATGGTWGINGAAPPDGWHRRTAAALYNDHVSTTIPQAGTSYSYPSAGIVDVTDTGGRQWRFTGGTHGITGIRRPGASSDTMTVAYSGPGSTVSSVTKDAVTTQYSRIVSGSVATMTVTNALNQTTSVVSDLTIGRPTSVTDPLNRTTAFQYDSAARPKRITAPEGNYVEHSYDARGNVTQTMAVPKSGSGPTIVTSASFDPACSNPATCNQPDSTTDARGNVTDYTYDPTHGGVLTVTAPAPTPGAVRPQTRYSYTLTNGEYRVTGVSQCRTASSCAGTADEVKTALAYDPNGNLYWAATGDGGGALVAASTMTYDALGNPVTVDGPLPGTADTGRVRYNPARQVIGRVSPDPDGGGPLKHRAVRNSYDSLTGLLAKVEQGNVDSQSDSDWAAFAPAQAVETIYDANARPVVGKLTSGSTVHALGQTSYDALGRPECSAQRMNPAAFGSTLPAACSLGAQGTGSGDFGPDRISKALYDSAGRVYQTRTAVGTADEAAEVTATFSANGQVQTVTDAENNKTSYEYDGHDRPAKTFFPLPAKGAGTSNANDFEESVRDSNGNVTSFRNRANETIAFTYDAIDRPTLKDLPGTEPDIAYGYDLLGRMTSASKPGHALSFGYDALGRNVTQTGPLGILSNQIVSSRYDLAGRRTRLTWPDGYYVDQDYLVTGEMSAIRENGATSGAGVLAAFAYDDLGRRVSLVRGNGVVTSYAYDSASRLASLAHDLAGTAHDLTFAFSHSPASQIVSRTASNDAYAWTGHGSGSTSSSVNGLNQLVSHGGAVPTHDAKGNLTSEGGRSFAFDSENKLTGIAPPGGIAAAVDYTPMMGIYSVYQSGGSARTHYLHYGGARLGEYFLGNLAGRHVHGPGVDEPLVAIDGSGGKTWFLADERGSIVAGTDSNGNVASINRYDEYGRPQGSQYYRFGYTGQASLYGGLFDYKARIYDPRLGRFLQPDPIGYGAGMNMYAYVGGDPVNFTDPSGLCRDGNGKYATAPTGSRICGGNGGGGGIAASLSRGSSLAFGGNAHGGLSGSVYVPGKSGSVSSSGRDIMIAAGSPGGWLNIGSFGAAGNSSAWTTNDFLGHYFRGNGDTVNLAEIGLSSLYVSHPSVMSLTGAYMNALEKLPLQAFWAPKMEIGNTNVTNTIFALGKSALYAAGGCQGADCFFRFSIDDKFEDPIHIGIEMAFGVPYDIVYEWSVVKRRAGR